MKDFSIFSFLYIFHLESMQSLKQNIREIYYLSTNKILTLVASFKLIPLRGTSHIFTIYKET